MIINLKEYRDINDRIGSLRFIVSELKTMNLRLKQKSNYGIVSVEMFSIDEKIDHYLKQADILQKRLDNKNVK